MDIKEYVNLANYIVILEMYFNKFVKANEIEENDLKKYSCGHWGCSPSINFIYANLYNYFSINNLDGKIVVGTGHAGASIMANLWLTDNLFEYYGKYSRDLKGLNELIKDFGNIIRTEINPQYPLTSYDGGELGYSLAFSYGYCLNTKQDVVACIFGDGEAETPTLMSSLLLNRIIETDKILPILNLNGLKMGSESIFSKFSEKELKNYFKGLGFKPYIFNEENFDLNIINLKRKPIIIFKSTKGINGPDFAVGNLQSHKNPLSSIKNNDEKIKILNEWLMKYDLKNIKIPKIKSKKNDVEQVIIKEVLNNENSLKSFDELIYNNDIKIFSPDEIISNKMILCSQKKSHLIEILSENVLQAMMQGYNQANGNSIMISYEAFMPLNTSLVSQYAKYIYQSKKLSFRKPKNSLNYFLTSTCWENNYSHQNPEFASSMLIKDYNFINVIYPKNIKDLLIYTKNCLKSKDQINVITYSKGDMELIKETECKDIEIYYNNDNPDIILCATGDYILRRTIKIKNELEKQNKKVKIIYIANLNILKKLSTKELELYFNPGINAYYLFHGYASTIKSLLYDKVNNVTVYGYKDKSDICGNTDDKLDKNEMSIEKVVEEINEKN